MSMSLTISQPTRTEFGNRFSSHEFNPRISLHKSRFSPQPRVDSPSPVSSLRVSVTPADNDTDKMSTHPHPHRGLPPPSAMTLPDPRRDGHPLSQPLGVMPAPPNQWQGQEESMRNWLLAKAEEDKRKQEEERTRQETLKLEQRKIEQSMLRESLQGGVPPQMVPMIYAGIGGANLAHVSLDWLQQYAGQLQAAQQQLQQQTSPDIRREQSRMIGPPPPGYPIAPTQQQVLPSQATEQPQPPPGPMQTTFSAYPPSAARQPPTSVPRSATHTQLPKLTTNEMYVHNPPQPGAGSAHPLHQSQTIHQQEQASSSPSIYFHHWVPPSETKSGTQPQTPASKGEPHSAHPSSSLREPEYRESPRKRKAQGGHDPNPPPSAGPQYSSPSFSTTSSTAKGGHMRSRSDSRPESSSHREDPPPPQKQPDSGTTNVGAASTEESSQRPASRNQEQPQKSSGAAHPELPRPGSR